MFAPTMSVTVKIKNMDAYTYEQQQSYTPPKKKLKTINLIIILQKHISRVEILATWKDKAVTYWWVPCSTTYIPVDDETRNLVWLVRFVSSDRTDDRKPMNQPVLQAPRTFERPLSLSLSPVLRPEEPSDCRPRGVLQGFSRSIFVVSQIPLAVQDWTMGPLPGSRCQYCEKRSVGMTSSIFLNRGVGWSWLTAWWWFVVGGWNSRWFIQPVFLCILST